MRKKIVLHVLYGMMLAGCSSTPDRDMPEMSSVPIDARIVVEHVESEKGQLLVYLHDKKASYYSDDNIRASSIKYFYRKRLKPSMPVTEVLLKDIPAGRYAVSVIHDKDRNGRLNRMVFPFIGMPSEPYGLSNNAYRPFSKGSFEGALVDVTEQGQSIHVRLSTHLSKTIGL